MLAAQQGRFALWLPVFMGTGVLLYFSLRSEPPIWAGVAIALPLALGVALAGPRPRPCLLPLLAAALGFSAAQFATARAPALDALPRQAVHLRGTVRALELLPEGRRITLTHVQIENGADLHRSVRLRLRSNDTTPIDTGDTIGVRALVQSPSPPAYPGGWDLQRDAFYAGLAGYGFALGPAELIAHHPVSGFAGWVQALRETIARRFHTALPGARGAVGATLLTGVPSAIPEIDREAFRDSGLAHLLAVAGLHIGIVMGLALGASRLLLASWEYAALRWPTKQISALAALIAGGMYMVLTGMHVPIIRSFAMAGLFTLAVLTGRRAVSVRGLALAATVLMLIEPQEVPGVSFQMSFSAVLALIAGYEALRPHLHALYGDGALWRRTSLHIVALALTSALAGTASAPFGAYHFGHIQLYFVLANMIAVPLTAIWVMPAGLIALFLMPLGLERLALIPMGWGLSAIIWIARTTAALPYATLDVPHVPPWGLALVALGMAWIGLWRGRIRVAGVVLLVIGLVSPALIRPPDLLVAADARMVGVRTAAGMFVERESGASKFTRDAWRQYWADGPPMLLPSDGIAAEGVVVCTSANCVLRPRTGAMAALLLREGRAPECEGVAVVVAIGRTRDRCRGALLLDRTTVLRQGATAVWLDATGARIVTDQQARGIRPWMPPPPDRHVPPPLDLPLAPAGA
ncbi:MAG TPA: ComEC/Rec2 family competence protein [Acetobacteraceae bacterium]|nr:ComEC/Rec2 family competence protein [Acetobacteraceae bacterium]